MLHADTRVHTDRESLADARDAFIAGEKSDKSDKSDKPDTFGGTPQEKSLAEFLSDDNGFQRNIGHTNNLGALHLKSADHRLLRLLQSTIRGNSM